MTSRDLRRTRGLAFAAILAVLPATARATDRGSKPLTLEAIFSPNEDVRVEFGGSPLADLVWLDDGEHYLQPATGEETFEPPLKTELSNGKTQPLFAAEDMIRALSRLPGFSAEDARQLNKEQVRFNAAYDALVVSQANDLFYFSPTSGRAQRLTHDSNPEELARFSPDGRFVSFVRDNDLHLVSVDADTERALTRGASSDLLFGKLDWVYQEELYGRGNFKGYWWSPDSRRIAFLQLDESPVHEFTIVDHLTTPGTTETVTYPKAGAPNPRVQVGVVRALGGEPVWMQAGRYQPADHLVVQVGWIPTGEKLFFMVQDREQTWLDLNLADPDTGAVETLLHETSPAFVDVGLSGEPHWLTDGSFLWLSGRSGYHHIYLFEPGGDLLRQLTQGDWEVRALHGVDEVAGWIYFSASEHRATETHVYRTRLDGSAFERLSTRPGTHDADFDPTFSYYIDTWSDILTPPQVHLHRADGSEIRVIDANEVKELAEYRLGDIEFLQVPLPDGFEMEALWIKPPGFDPSQKYPVVQYTYGGPHAPVVRNRWGGSRNMWLHFLAQEGWLVWMCDNRSASGKGIAPTWEAHRRLGETELRDIEVGLEWLGRQPWVDADRVGIWGWSYGGFMASFALTHSTKFRAGIAGAPVTDWRLYDSIYTERYMRMPQNNPEGYKASSVVEAAANLHGKLLLIHGTMDDNVHLQNTFQLIHALQESGKEFELMLYPTARHGVPDPEQRYHLYRLMTDFLKDNL